VRTVINYLKPLRGIYRFTCASAPSYGRTLSIWTNVCLPHHNGLRLRRLKLEAPMIRRVCLCAWTPRCNVYRSSKVGFWKGRWNTAGRAGTPMGTARGIEELRPPCTKSQSSSTFRCQVPLVMTCAPIAHRPVMIIHLGP
jgi:hypothetical protein